MQGLREHDGEMAIPAPVWHELRFGCARLRPSRRREALERYLEAVVLVSFPVLPYTREAADWHALERARLSATGRTPPFVDGQIAAIRGANLSRLIGPPTRTAGVMHADRRSSRNRIEGEHHVSRDRPARSHRRSPGRLRRQADHPRHANRRGACPGQSGGRGGPWRTCSGTIRFSNRRTSRHAFSSLTAHWRENMCMTASPCERLREVSTPDFSSPVARRSSSAATRTWTTSPRSRNGWGSATTPPKTAGPRRRALIRAIAVAPGPRQGSSCSAGCVQRCVHLICTLLRNPAPRRGRKKWR